MNTQYGYGDEITWGPATSPRDPRWDEDDWDDEEEEEEEEACLLAEYPRGDNPLDTQYTAIYPDHLRPGKGTVTPASRSNSMNLVIASTAIRIDTEGRYCLNDLHRASGGDNKHRPSIWVENQQTQALIDEIEKAGIPAIQSKQGLGTFVAKELVYAYAMWISAAFHLKVIRAYDAMIANGQVSLAASKFYDQIPKSLPDALRLAAGEMEKNAILEAKVAEQAPKVEALDRIAASKDTLTVTQAAKLLDKKVSELTTLMHAKGWMYRQNGSWVAYQQHIQNGNLTYKEANYTDEKTGLSCIRPYCHITQKGLVKLAQMLGTNPPDCSFFPPTVNGSSPRPHA